MEVLYQTAREPKTLELQKTDDGLYRLLIMLKKLGAVSALQYFLDAKEARELSQALLNKDSAWVILFLQSSVVRLCGAPSRSRESLPSCWWTLLEIYKASSTSSRIACSEA